MTGLKKGVAGLRLPNLITIRNSMSLIWDLGTAAPFGDIFFCPGKDKFFFEEDTIEILFHIYEIKLIRSGPACVQDLAKDMKKRPEWSDLRICGPDQK